MKKYIFPIVLFIALGILWPLLQPRIGALLIQRELASEEKVKDILAYKDQKHSDSLEVFWQNEEMEYRFPEAEIIKEMVKGEENAVLEENVLGWDDERWIEVVLSEQRIYAWEGDRLVYNFLVSTGKWAPTPVGDFRVWIKLASTKMSGGSKELGTYYYLPNVPCTMYFYKGYGIHGAYWHNNFGQPMSHGCVNMRPVDSCVLFNWASVGTRVNVHE